MTLTLENEKQKVVLLADEIIINTLYNEHKRINLVKVEIKYSQLFKINFMWWFNRRLELFKKLDQGIIFDKDFVIRDETIPLSDDIKEYIKGFTNG